MKKLFTLVAFVLSAMSMQAESYNGTLRIEVGEPLDINVNQTSDLEVNEEDGGTYELKLSDFSFQGLLVGTIDVPGVKAEVHEDYTELSYKGPTTIQPASGSDKGFLNGQTVKLDLTGKFDKETGILAANIAIVASQEDETLNINVNFTNAQIPNSDFENFNTFKPGSDYVSQTEPTYWHGFGSSMTKEGAFMDFSGFLKYYNQIEESEDVRDDEDAPTTKCVKLTSVNVLGISISNGTLTTGRLQAGSMTATSPDNCAFLDLSNTDKDEKGNPFYTRLTTIPDSINLWVKYIRGGEDADYEIKKDGKGTGEYSTTASVKAVITDGTYYQDPEDKEYTNIIGVAKDATIDTKGEWKNITIPFDYSMAKEGATPKAILVNITTNAYPGIGSKNDKKPDELYVDDLSLVYNAGLKSVKFKGKDLDIVKVKDQTLITVNNAGEYSSDDFEVESDGVGAYVSYAVEQVYDPDFDEYADELHIKIVSADLQKENNYVVTINGGTLTGVNHTKVNLPNGVKAIYNLAGQQVSSMTSGNVYIVKTTDGKTKKVIKK